MAGIGFDLSKIFGKKTLTANTLGVVHVSTAAMASVFICMIWLFLIKGNMYLLQAQEAEESLFFYSFVGIFLLSAFICSLVSGVLSRYISDKLVEEKGTEICASMFGMLMISTILSAIGAGVLCIVFWMRGILDFPLLFVYYLVAILLTDANVILIFASMIKAYKRIILAYVTALVVFFAVTVSLYSFSDVSALGSIYGGLFCGFMVLTLFLICICLKVLGAPEKRYFDFWAYAGKKGILSYGGLMFFLGVSVSLFGYWYLYGPGGQGGGFENAPLYEAVFLLTMICNLPGMLIFVWKLRARFAERYVEYLAVMEKGTFEAIERKRESLQNTMKLQLFYVYGMQFVTSLLGVCFLYACKDCLGLTDAMSAFLFPCAIGMCLVFCLYFSMIFLCYFLCYREMAVCTTVFAIAAIIGVFFCGMKNVSLAFALVAAGALGWLTGLLLLRKKLRELNAYLLCK